MKNEFSVLYEGTVSRLFVFKIISNHLEVIPLFVEYTMSIMGL